MRPVEIQARVPRAVWSARAGTRSPSKPVRVAKRARTPRDKGPLGDALPAYLVAWYPRRQSGSGENRRSLRLGMTRSRFAASRILLLWLDAPNPSLTQSAHQPTEM